MSKTSKPTCGLTDTFRHYAAMRLKFRSGVVSDVRSQVQALQNKPLPPAPKQAA